MGVDPDCGPPDLPQRCGPIPVPGYSRLLNGANHLIFTLIVRADSVTPNEDAFCCAVANRHYGPATAWLPSIPRGESGLGLPRPLVLGVGSRQGASSSKAAAARRIRSFRRSAFRPVLSAVAGWASWSWRSRTAICAPNWPSSMPTAYIRSPRAIRACSKHRRRERADQCRTICFEMAKGNAKLMPY